MDLYLVFVACHPTAELYVVEPRALLGVEEVHACCRRVAQAEAVEEGTLLLRIPADAYLR